MDLLYGPLAIIMCGLTPVKARQTGYICPICQEPREPSREPLPALSRGARAGRGSAADHCPVIRR